MISMLVAFVLHSLTDKGLVSGVLNIKMANASYLFFHSTVMGNAFENVNLEMKV
jgi:hypothetical protein